MKTKILILLTMMLAGLNSFSADFARLETFVDDEKLWNRTSDNFLDPSNQMYFRWLSDKKEGVRYPGYGNSPPMTFLGMKSWETIIRFEGGKVSQIEISLFNRGDSGEITDDKGKKSEDIFMGMVDEDLKKIEAWAGDKGVSSQRERLTMGMYIERKVWVKNNSLAVEMKWSASEKIKAQDVEDPFMRDKKIRFRAEYIKLTISKFDPKNDPRKMTSTPKKADVASAMDIKQNVKKDDKGFIYIENIPMVDQGQKGYCAVATAERILKYYGTDADQNVLAQLASSSSSRGTSPDEMIDMLKKVQGKFGVMIRTHVDFKLQDFMKMVNDYNKLSKKAGKREIGYGRVIDIGAIYHAMGSEPAMLKEAKCEKDKSGYKGFQTDIMKHVDAGIPLMWSVILGIVKEEGLPQAGGGHMRIIFGYNKEKSEILYTDSWGAKHERKVMPMDDAWTITTGLYSFDPRKK
ncbi:MAG TPA: hypothetical protein DET40_05675 [Lentisphaeria bacterium]|nr:MAG: hypothetical protein A2X45_12415 [Lentisphaerae bacterium GWF2_50_93]HCE43016.1 hypothetical protein [Lentisphaeria bacterium]